MLAHSIYGLKHPDYYHWITLTISFPIQLSPFVDMI
jgi:hypothetical protein